MADPACIKKMMRTEDMSFPQAMKECNSMMSGGSDKAKAKEKK